MWYSTDDNYGSDGKAVSFGAYVEGIPGLGEPLVGDEYAVYVTVRDMGDGIIKSVCGGLQITPSNQDIPLSLLPSTCQCENN